MVLSLLFIILLRFLAGIMVWVMIVMVILVLGYGASLPPCILLSPQPAKCSCPLSCWWPIKTLLCKLLHLEWMGGEFLLWLSGLRI